MRQARVSYRHDALADLENIYRFIADTSGSHPVAAGFVTRIMARCRKIGDAPLGGRLRTDLAPGLRTVAFERTVVIAYLVREDVEITNVFYGGRDYEALYHDRPEDEADGS
ncbi:type II toxin-antitoxin system RelE/ParE family toxin [Ancylobacter polymorphus]|uniref:Type II toxin-antitoxin system RelE/ParE family toxin n=1 Tax=Ancylobacter polymorphus TaxID=223390 RepID=A0A9E7A6V7_9HYPH|nr:type II toxin-antitoxin system RelE/ParE family toxin [Ancylobacter polymorphus]UOK73978.1 type II toxin-antitoxin system RelE/ParE family toxin [Ancylobacter polymorphus]